jgi:serine/threonine-protein kinase
MSGKASSSQRGRLPLAEDSTVDMRPPGRRQVQLARDPVLGLLALEERFSDRGEIGHGGMGAVHRVLERTLNREVAMKVLHQQRAHEQRVRQRFITEAQVTAQLDHPNIVPVHELGVDDDGKLFFTMRLIEGRTLSAMLAEQPADSDEAVEAALEVFFRVCDALAFAHDRGVVHRDVKPSNIMVGDFGQVYLTDWGLARVLAPGPGAAAGAAAGGRRKTTTLSIPAVDDRGLVVGTYQYMAPEQARGALDEIDARTDVFSLGAVLFRIAAGRPPIDGDSAAEALDNAAAGRRVQLGEPLRGALRRALLEVAEQALEPDRERRFSNAVGLKRAAQQVLRGRFRFPVRRLPAGARVVVEGERGDDAYYIRSGRCRVYSERDGQRVELQQLGPGEVFGETAVFTGQPRNATVEAAEPVELIQVPGTFLSDTLGLDSWTGAFVRTLGERFTAGSRRVARLQQKGRLAELAVAALRLMALEAEADPAGGRRLPAARLREQLQARHGLDLTDLPAVLEQAGLQLAGAGAAQFVRLAPS